MPTPAHIRDSHIHHTLPSCHALAMATLIILSSAAQADQTLLNTSASFTTSNQSIWQNGDAFIFDYNRFLGFDSGGRRTATFGSGNNDVVSVAGYSVNPYFSFTHDYRIGLELGANINGGSINANLDYDVLISAPDTIRQGERFSLNASATKLNTSSFSTTAANASAYVDGVVDVYLGTYARFEVDRPWPLSTQDLRLGNRGFTSGNTSNTPNYTLANIDERMEIIGINRDQSGVLRYLGGSNLGDGDLLYDQIGAGSSVGLGPISFTAGNWNVDAQGSQTGSGLAGGNEETLLTATLDVDHLMLGSSVLGLGIDHDWGLIDYDLGYEVLDYDANLDIGLSQEFLLNDDLLITLTFSDDVELDGIGITNTFTGMMSAIPDITLLGNSVDVHSLLFVDAMLTNNTGLTFGGSLDLTLFEAWLIANYDFLGLASGSIANRRIGPAYDSSLPFDLGNIEVFNEQFALAGFDVIDGGMFTLRAVPLPGAVWLFGSALMGLVVMGRKRLTQQPNSAF